MAALKYVPVKMPPEMLRYVDELRAQLQAEQPDKAINRSDAIRYCIEATAAATDQGMFGVVYPKKDEQDE